MSGYGAYPITKLLVEITIEQLTVPRFDKVRIEKVLGDFTVLLYVPFH